MVNLTCFHNMEGTHHHPITWTSQVEIKKGSYCFGQHISYEDWLMVLRDANSRQISSQSVLNDTREKIIVLGSSKWNLQENESFFFFLDSLQEKKMNRHQNFSRKWCKLVKWHVRFLVDMKIQICPFSMNSLGLMRCLLVRKACLKS